MSDFLLVFVDDGDVDHNDCGDDSGGGVDDDVMVIIIIIIVTRKYL